MQRSVIDVGAETVVNHNSMANFFRGLAEMLLFVENEVLRACYDTCSLDTLNGLGHQDSSQSWVGAMNKVSLISNDVHHVTEKLPKPFPIASAFWRSSERTGNRSQLDINTLSTVFLAHCLASGICKAAIEGGCDIDASRKDRVVISISQANR